MNTFRRIFLISIIALINTACVINSSPPNNIGFANVTELNEFNGTYLNIGEGGSESGSANLSHVIWPDSDLDHNKIEAIYINTIDHNNIEVSAKSNKSTIRKQIFKLGEDFKIKNGRITLEGGAEGVNDNIAGVGYEKRTLGLDKEGNGKYRQSGSFIGIALLFPIAVTGKYDVRYRKIDDPN